jgi:hypothetical protein
MITFGIRIMIIMRLRAVIVVIVVITAILVTKTALGQ